MESLMNSGSVVLAALGDFIVLLGVLLVGRAFYGWTFGIKLDQELNEKGNVAVAVGMSGYLIGIVIAASGGLLSVGDSAHKAIMIGAIGLVSIFLMRISLFFNDRFMLPQFRNMDEIVKNKNIGIAFIESGSCMASGLMIYGIMTGPAENLKEKIMTGFEYWMVGQILLIIGSWLYHLICGFKITDELGPNNHNVAAGISMGGFLLAIGFILEAAFHNISTKVSDEMITVAIFCAAGFVLLTGTKWVIDKILAHGATGKEIAEDGNIGAGLLAAVGFICVGLMFSGAITPATDFASMENKVKEIQKDIQ